MGVCTRLLQKKHLATMKGCLLPLCLLVFLSSVVAESSNGKELKDFASNGEVLARQVREADKPGKKKGVNPKKKGKNPMKKRKNMKKSQSRRKDGKGKKNTNKAKKQNQPRRFGKKRA